MSLIAGAALRAEPIVVGFERFYSAAPSAEGGRLLFNELGCANCHAIPTGLPPRRGPELAGVGERLQADWVAALIKNPSAARTGSAMPQCFSANASGDASAVLPYLASLKPTTVSKPKPARHVNALHGGELFHAIGCAACHQGAKAAADSDSRSVAFPALGEKYVLNSLADFIRDPLKTRRDGRMPRVAMDEQDALDLAGWLLGFEGSDGQSVAGVKPWPAEAQAVARGRAVIAAARCAACHDLPADVSARPVPLTKNEGGCLSAAQGVPRYELAPLQVESLKLFLARREVPPAAPDLARLTMESLNCLACHSRDGRGGPEESKKDYFSGDPNLGDTGRFPPPLTRIGAKLRPEWLEKVMTGSARVRPYLQTRMPIFGEATKALPALLASVDKMSGPALSGGDDAAGRKLLGTQGGLGCITCHRWGTHASLGIQALDLSNISQRLQPGWLHDYLIDPAAHRPGTLMPSFWPLGVASNREILGGDTAAQIASIYAFAGSANGEPEGYPATVAGEFELVPKDQPIVLRTFFEGVGTHAILVGFPEGIHLAYDGKNARPALAWRGRFFDAYNTWFSRFAPFEKPLGEAVFEWPAASPEPVRFEGYRLDKKRVPIFIFTIHGTRVEERFEPIEGGLSRTLSWAPDAPPPPPSLHPNCVVQPTADAPGTRSFRYLWK